MKLLNLATLFAAVGFVAAHGYYEGNQPAAKRGLHARDFKAGGDDSDLWSRDPDHDDLHTRGAKAAPYYHDAELHTRKAAAEAEWMDENLFRRGNFLSGPSCQAQDGGKVVGPKPPRLPHIFKCPICGCVYLKPGEFIPKCKNNHPTPVTTQQISTLDAEQIYKVI